MREAIDGEGATGLAQVRKLKSEIKEQGSNQEKAGLRRGKTRRVQRTLSSDAFTLQLSTFFHQHLRHK